MGFGSWAKKAWKKATHAVGKVFKAATSATKYVANPVRGVKDLLNNPLNFIVKATGADVLFGLDKNIVVNTTQATRQRIDSSEEKDMSAQERARMVSRQGMQGSLPIMLLGQDFSDTHINNDDQELRGDRR